MEVSIIIPSYTKRSFKITLDSMRSQIFSKNFEILIIRNGSSKNSLFRDGNLTIIDIKKVGANIARNLGIKKSKGNILAFTDDDVIAPINWIKNIYEAHNEYDGPAIGGRVIPKWPREGKPDWVKGVLLDYLSLLDISPIPTILKKWDWIVGVNMSFKREIFNKVGYFDVLLDRVEENLQSCGETEFCDRLRSADFDIYYDPKIVIKHIISNNRLTQTYFLQRAFWQGISDYRVDEKSMNKKQIERNIKNHMNKINKSQIIQTNENHLFINMCTTARSLGYVQGKY